MALTDTQKAEVRLYLGYSDASRGGPGDLERALVSLSTPAETQVAAVLTSLAGIDTRLTASWDRQKILKAEDVVLAGEGELRALRGEGSRLVRRLATILGVPVGESPFQSSMSSGIARRGA